MSDRLTCSSEGCERLAVESLWLRDQPGHTHDCPEHGHDVREWCDVTQSEPIIEGRCQAATCTGNTAIWFGPPTPLGDA